MSACWKRTSSLPLLVSTVEEQAVSSVWLEELLQHLSSDERRSFSTNCISRTSQNGLSAWSLEFPNSSVISVNVKLLQKIKKIFENMGKA